jgi:hypothetical protein
MICYAISLFFTSLPCGFKKWLVLVEFLFLIMKLFDHYFHGATSETRSQFTFANDGINFFQKNYDISQNLIIFREHDVKHVWSAVVVVLPVQVFVDHHSSVLTFSIFVYRKINS